MRQKNNLKASQEMELMNIENAQKKQFIEFSEAWDNYMADYEATAYLSLEKLKVKGGYQIGETCGGVLGLPAKNQKGYVKKVQVLTRSVGAAEEGISASEVKVVRRGEWHQEKGGSAGGI